jgi:hypothetical protein
VRAAAAARAPQAPSQAGPSGVTGPYSGAHITPTSTMFDLAPSELAAQIWSHVNDATDAATADPAGLPVHAVPLDLGPTFRPQPFATRAPVELVSSVVAPPRGGLATGAEEAVLNVVTEAVEGSAEGAAGGAPAAAQPQLVDCGVCIACRDKPKFGGLGKRKQACLRGAAAQTPLYDCGVCAACRDKPKFGGPGKRHQACQYKSKRAIHRPNQVPPADARTLASLAAPPRTQASRPPRTQAANPWSAFVNTARKPGTAAGRRVTGGDGASADESAAETEREGSINWLQCDVCLKWRVQPAAPSGQPQPLRTDGEWRCSMNSDVRFSSCSAPEQTEEEARSELAGARSRFTYDLGEFYIGRRALFGCSYGAGELPARRLGRPRARSIRLPGRATTRREVHASRSPRDRV